MHTQNATFKTLDIRPEGQFYVGETIQMNERQRLTGSRLTDDFATESEARVHLEQIKKTKPDAYLCWGCRYD